MTGRFIAVVGPSGVGKDSVMEALASADPRIVLARRVITRPAGAGGEAFDPATYASFQSRDAQGEFILSWSAHGLHYAIPASVTKALQNGMDVLANLSRGMLAQAQSRFDRFEVIHLTADRAILAKRLLARGRETSDQIAKRLNRTVPPLPSGLIVHHIDNSGTLAQTVDAVLARIYPVKG